MATVNKAEPSDQDMRDLLIYPVTLHTIPPSSLKGVQVNMGFDLHSETNKINRQLLGKLYTKNSRSPCPELNDIVQLSLTPSEGCVILRSVEFEVVDELGAGIIVGLATSKEIHVKWSPENTIKRVWLSKLNTGNKTLLTVMLGMIN